MNDKQKLFFFEAKKVVDHPSNVTDSFLKDIAASINVRVPWKLIVPHETSKNVFDISALLAHVDDNFENYVPIKGPSTKPKSAPDIKKPNWEMTPVEMEQVRIAEVTEEAPAGFFVPTLNPAFVAHGNMSTVKKIINSRQFCPTYIFGDTGLGKSLSVCQFASKKGIEVIRIAVNAHTNEEDFIGGFRLVNGETVWQDGPLVLAMKRGAILLIDELTSLNPAYAFCLFSPLEGGAVIIKKTNKIIQPKPGFNIIATDNTRGNGTSSGRWVGVNVQNQALLDRFIVSVEYKYPSAANELRMLSHFSNDETNMKDLVKWANVIRNAYADGAMDVTISTRRIVNILKINNIFKNLKESIQNSIARYEEDTTEALLDFFDKIVSDPNYSNDDIFNEVANS